MDCSYSNESDDEHAACKTHGDLKFIVTISIYISIYLCMYVSICTIYVSTYMYVCIIMYL